MTRVLPFSRRRAVPDPRRVAEFADLARRLSRERAEAPAQVDRLLAAAGSAGLASLSERPELRNAGALDYLSTLIAEELPREPAYAEGLAVLAADVAERLRPPEYPATVVKQLRAHALTDVARVRRALAQFDRAVEALERAAAILDDWLAHDLAIVGVELALTYRDMGRPAARVRAMLAECAEVLRDHGDVGRALHADALSSGMKESPST